MFTEVCIAAFGYHVADKLAKNSEDAVMVKNTEPTSLNELKKVHEVLSCLIRGVYAVDKEDLQDSASQFWTSIGYEHVDLRTLNLTSADYDGDKFEKDLKRIADVPRPSTGDVCSVARLVLFRRCEGRGDERLIDAGVRPEVTVDPPQYVVAIRGTILRRTTKKTVNLGDINADIKVFLETLHAATDLYEPVSRLVKAICRQGGAGCVDRVWIAGHSLGAMIALHATRELALMNTAPLVLSPHLFNLPYSSFFGLVNSVCRSICQTLDKGIPNLGWKPPTFDGLRKNLAGMVQDCLYTVAEAVDPAYGEQVRVESVTLKDRDYFPYMYLNPNDPISRGYIGHFGVTDVAGQPSTEPLLAVPSKSHSLSSSVLRCVKIDAKSSNRVTHARLIINHWGKGPNQAHKLHQWFLYPTVDAKVYRTTRESVEV